MLFRSVSQSRYPVVEGLIKQNIGNEEFREKVKVHLGIDIDEDGFDLMEFSDAMARYGNLEEQFKLMIKLFTDTEIDDSDVDTAKEQLTSDVEGEPVEATVQTNVNTEANVQNAAEAGQQVEQEVQDATPDQVEATTDANISFKEFIIQNAEDLWGVLKGAFEVQTAYAEGQTIEISPQFEVNTANLNPGDVFTEIQGLFMSDGSGIMVQVDFSVNDDGTLDRTLYAIDERDGSRVEITLTEIS